MNRLICSIVYGHRPKTYDLKCAWYVCRCGANVMEGDEMRRWFGDVRTTRLEKWRIRRRTRLVLWGAVGARQYGSDDDRWAIEHLDSAYLTGFRDSMLAMRAEMYFSLPVQPNRMAVIKGVLS